MLHQPSAHNGSARRGKRRGAGPRTDGGSTPLLRHARRNDGERARNEQSGADALDGPRRHHGMDTVGGSAPCGCGGEDAHADQVQPLAAETIADGAAC